MIVALLVLAAFIVFVLATFNMPAKINLVACGLALWALSELLGKVLPK